MNFVVVYFGEQPVINCSANESNKSEIKRIWIRFTCVSLFHYKISLLFLRFFLLIFASNFSLRFTWVIFASKRNKAKQNSSLFFCYFSHFFAFFSLFSLFFGFFALNFLLRFDLVIFVSKRNKTKRNSRLFFWFFHFFLLFFAIFAFFTFFHFFSLNFRFASIFSLNFAYFTFVFASDFWCFALKWIMWNQAFFGFQPKRNFRFNFKFRFRSKSEGASYVRMDPIRTTGQPLWFSSNLQYVLCDANNEKLSSPAL